MNDTVKELAVLAAAAVIAIVPLAAEAGPPKTTYSSLKDGWSVRCVHDADTAEFSYCEASSVWSIHPNRQRRLDTEKVEISFILYAEKAAIAIQGDWTVSEGRKLRSKIKFDRESYSGKWYAKSNGLLLSGFFSKMSEFVTEVGESNKLYLEIGNKKLGRFPLKGSRKAIVRAAAKWLEFTGKDFNETFGGETFIDPSKNYTFGEGGEKVDTF